VRTAGFIPGEAYQIASLNIHVLCRNVPRMLLRKVHTRRLSRLIAGLFAVQIVVTGFCLLTSQAHAMPMEQMPDSSMADTLIEDMAEHCAKSIQGGGQYSNSSQSDGCFHCDEPDQFVSAASVDIAPVSPVFVALSVLPEMPALTTWDEATAFHTPTGPPRSSSLLFTITQRIRV